MKKNNKIKGERRQQLGVILALVSGIFLIADVLLPLKIIPGDELESEIVAIGYAVVPSMVFGVSIGLYMWGKNLINSQTPHKKHNAKDSTGKTIAWNLLIRPNVGLMIGIILLAGIKIFQKDLNLLSQLYITSVGLSFLVMQGILWSTLFIMRKRSGPH